MSDTFHPVIHLPETYDVYDFTSGYDPNRERLDYGIGRYNEARVGMYTEPQFAENARIVHMGIDIAAPIGTPVHSFTRCRIIHQGINPLPQDYGGTIVTEQWVEGRWLYALYGHLSHASLTLHPANTWIEGGTQIATIGNQSENGGWNPHLHFQLSINRPQTYDMPGAVSLSERANGLRIYPDPRIILGPLYEDS